MANSNLPFSRDAYDDLADLFLTESVKGGLHVDPAIDASPLPFPVRPTAATASAKAAEPSATSQSRLMAIMRVNLPVIAGPWLEQAAAAIASQAGPVVLIRERGGKACLDLVAGRDGQEAVTAALASPAESLPAAVRQLKSVIACWIVEAPSSAAVETDHWSGFDEIILLTGADEAATVAAFAQAKSICNVADDMPRLSLVVVGSEEENARRSAARITQACEESLGCAVELRAIVRRMQPVPMRHLGRFTQAGDLTSAITEALSQADCQAAKSPEAPVDHEPLPPQKTRPAPVTIPRVVLRPRTAAPSTSESIEPTRARRPEPAATTKSPTPQPAIEEPVSDEVRQTRRDSAPPAPAVQPTPVEPAASAAADTLLSLLSDLRPLEMSCPRAPGVELGFDMNGRIHALAEDTSEDALQQLFVASDWVREHRALLNRLNPWLASTNQAGREHVEVTAHLFTSQPRVRRHLADGAMKIHILVRDPTAAGQIVAHLELN